MGASAAEPSARSRGQVPWRRHILSPVDRVFPTLGHAAAARADSHPSRSNLPYHPTMAALRAAPSHRHVDVDMTILAQVDTYLASLAEPVRRDLAALHRTILALSPACRLWFLDGRDSKGKVVSNPNIGYGVTNIAHGDGRSREFYRVGISANTSGISVYIMGIEDKTYVARTYADRIGKAKLTGYCIKFRRLGDLDQEVLEAALRDGLSGPER